LALALFAACTGDSGSASENATPNILLIVTDDQAWSQFTPELMPGIERS